MKYDDASWHSGGDYPANSPPEYGATHIGLFLRWSFERGFIGEVHREEECAADVRRVISGELPGSDYLLNWCDGKLTDEDFDDRGNDFAERYYEDYLGDYASLFADLTYRAPEKNHDYEKLAKLLDERYRDAIHGGVEGPDQTPDGRPRKSWWRFW